MLFQGNTFALPTTFPAGYSNTPNTTAYGINVRTGHELRNNTFISAPANPTGVAARRVGAALRYQGVVLNNTFTGLDAGIEAVSGEWYMATTYDFQQNTFTDNTEGVSFLPPGYTLGSSGTVTMRCNTLSASAAGAKGISVKPNTVFPATMGSSTLPNGNRFDGPAFTGTGAASRLVYNGYNSAGSFVYSSYNSPQEYYSAAAPATQTVGVAQVYISSAPGSASTCGGSTQPGVYARVQPLALTAAGLHNMQDSLREAALPASRQQALLLGVLGYYRQTQQYDGLDTYTQAVSSAHPAVAIAGSLALLHAYEQTGRHADMARLRTTLGVLALQDQELLNFLRFWDAERQLRFAALALGRKVVEPAGQLLRLAAASGTLAARPACQLLQLYEPNCRCVLPTVPSLALFRRQAATRTPTPLLEAAYPNPANEAVTVRYRLPLPGILATLAISDALGRPVLTRTLSQEATETTFSVRALPTGLYHVMLLLGGQVQTTQKLAVVR